MRCVAIGLTLALSLSCQKTPAQDALSESEQEQDQNMVASLEGEYLEHWGPDAQGETKHRFTPKQWIETRAGQSIKLKLVKLKAQGASQWSAIFAYTVKSSQEEHSLRLDLYQTKEQSLWICRHPSLPSSDPLQASSAEVTDLRGQGCFGTPWRKLEAMP